MKKAIFTCTGLLLALVMMTAGFAESSFLKFHLPSWLMGTGIAIDVFLATVGKFQDRKLSFWNWTLPICATHIGFPAFGYWGMWELTKNFPTLHPILGTIGFIFVALFVYEVICESAGKEPIIAISGWVSAKFGFEENDTRRWIAIFAVSWDALWSGPAKSAQASAGHWDNAEVLGSFVIAGIVVAIVAQVALIVAMKLQQMRFNDAIGLAKFSFRGKIVELSVIGGFGVLSLLDGWGISESIWVATAISLAIISLTFKVLHEQIMENELIDAFEAIDANKP